jgi:hypothetical protein
MDNGDIFKTLNKQLSSFNSKKIIKILIKHICQKKRKFSCAYILNFIELHSLYANDSDIAYTIIKYFSNLKIKEGLEWVKKQISNEKKEFVIVAAIRAVKILGDINCVELLYNFMNKSFSSYVKREAMSTIKFLQKDIKNEEIGGLRIADENQIGNLSIKDNSGELSLPEDKKND